MREDGRFFLIWKWQLIEIHQGTPFIVKPFAHKFPSKKLRGQKLSILPCKRPFRKLWQRLFLNIRVLPTVLVKLELLAAATAGADIKGAAAALLLGHVKRTRDDGTWGHRRSWSRRRNHRRGCGVFGWLPAMVVVSILVRRMGRRCLLLGLVPRGGATSRSGWFSHRTEPDRFDEVEDSDTPLLVWLLQCPVTEESERKWQKLCIKKYIRY